MVEQKNSKTHLTPFLLILMATTTGVAVASNYYAQPLLRTFTNYFSISETDSASIVVAAQLAYALGLLLLVPLGDIFERKKLTIGLMLLSTLGLVISAVAPSFQWLRVGCAMAALFSAVAQVLVPYASALAEPSHRGRAVGIVVSGLLFGILLAGTFSGLISTLWGWHIVYAIAAVLMFLMTVALALRLPSYEATLKVGYLALIFSIFRLFKQFAALRFRSLLGGVGFATFSILWTPLGFLLHDHYGYSDLVIGMFGLAGVAGAMVAPLAGRFSDQGRGMLAIVIGLLILLVAWILVYSGDRHIICLLAGIVLLNAGLQLVHVTNMNEIYKLDLTARSRLNSGYMTCYFIGGVLGSVTSAIAYQHFYWLGVSIMGGGLTVILCIIALIGRRYLK